MNQRIRHRLWLLVCMLSAIIVFPRQVHADMGPKPSVHIQFENMDDELCYGTLLCENESTGPASIFDGSKEHARIKEKYPDSYYFEEKIWKAFVEYQDEDGYYFHKKGGLSVKQKKSHGHIIRHLALKFFFTFQNQIHSYPVVFMKAMHLIRTIPWI